MTSRSQMDDIQFRLEAIREDYPAGNLQEWQLQELIEDCAKLRADDPDGGFTNALLFIENMLTIIQGNLNAVKKLRDLYSKKCG